MVVIGYRGVAGKVEGIKMLVLQIVLGSAKQKTLLQQRLIVSKAKQLMHYYEHLTRACLCLPQVLQVQTAF